MLHQQKGLTSHQLRALAPQKPYSFRVLVLCRRTWHSSSRDLLCGGIKDASVRTLTCYSKSRDPACCSAYHGPNRVNSSLSNAVVRHAGGCTTTIMSVKRPCICNEFIPFCHEENSEATVPLPDDVETTHAWLRLLGVEESNGYLCWEHGRVCLSHFEPNSLVASYTSQPLLKHARVRPHSDAQPTRLDQHMRAESKGALQRALKAETIARQLHAKYVVSSTSTRPTSYEKRNGVLNFSRRSCAASTRAPIEPVFDFGPEASKKRLIHSSQDAVKSVREQRTVREGRLMTGVLCRQEIYMVASVSGNDLACVEASYQPLQQ